MSKGRRSKPNPVYINKDWRWSKDGNNVIIEQRTEAYKRDKNTRKPDPSQPYDVWRPRYFYSLENALKWAAEEDALVYQHLEPFVSALNNFKADIEKMANQLREVQG